MAWYTFGFRLIRESELISIQSELEAALLTASSAQQQVSTLEAKVRELTNKKQSAEFEIASLKEQLELAQRDMLSKSTVRDIIDDAKKRLTSLVSAWTFRQENPKMTPKARQVNNAALSEAIDGLVQDFDSWNKYLK